MEALRFILLILLTKNMFISQGLLAADWKNEESTLQRRLETINKPCRKSFQTKYGDIIDCVDIGKQQAFDHPLSKNHSIQMKPTMGRRSTISTTSQFLPKNMRCPPGTVPIRRIRKEELKMENFTPSFFASNGSDAVNGHEVAGIVTLFKNLGASGSINVWNRQVQPDQYSSASIYVASDDGSISNVIQIGWMISPSLYSNSTETRFYRYWTKDSGKSTGCFNTICPGFVQSSKNVYLGQVITPVSKRYGHQVFIDVEIRQDIRSKNWWLYLGGEAVGYWPAELFSTLKESATRVGWGGEIYSPPTETPPDMGSGYQADEGGYTRVCLMKNLNMLATVLFPQRQDLIFSMTSPDKYTVTNTNYGYWENYIYFGGPNKIN